mgnify:CR=1 FL=1
MAVEVVKRARRRLRGKGAPMDEDERFEFMISVIAVFVVTVFCLVPGFISMVLTMVIGIPVYLAYTFATSRVGMLLLAGAARSLRPTMRRMTCQTLGIVGFGSTGEKLATKAAGVGLRVLAHARSPKPARPDVTFCDLDSLLRESDFVSLHLPLTEQTRHLIGDDELAKMKSTACLINTARGGVVDQDALTRALAENRIAGAGLDVQDPEPPDLSQPLFQDPRVIVTPHAAFTSQESLDELRNDAAEQVADRLHGRRPENVVNPEVFEDPA